MPIARPSAHLCRYYHRNLNPPKLVDIGFAALPRNSTMSRMIRQYAVPEQPRLPGFREMVASDVPQVGDLLRRFLTRFDVAQTFGSDEEVMHWFISGQGRVVDGKRVEQVTWAYVVEVSHTCKLCHVADARRTLPHGKSPTWCHSTRSLHLS